MSEIVFDFQKYVAQRKGPDDAAAQSGSAYAYPGDLKVLRTLARVTPVTLAVEATARLWRGAARTALLERGLKVTEQQFPEVHRVACACAERLRIALPSMYVMPGSGGASTSGTSEDAYLVLGQALTEELGGAELAFAVGHECGHLQNGHVAYSTALHYLTHDASQFLRWIVRPAVMALEPWSRRAEITCDRAGLICAGELLPAASALVRLALGSTPPLPAAELLEQVSEDGQPSGALRELARAEPFLPRRLAALRLFSETHYFLRVTGRQPRENQGKSLGWCDARVKPLLAGIGRRGEAQGE